jgi:hypothetical protein
MLNIKLSSLLHRAWQLYKLILTSTWWEEGKEGEGEVWKGGEEEDRKTESRNEKFTKEMSKQVNKEAIRL